MWVVAPRREQLVRVNYFGKSPEWFEEDRCVRQVHTLGCPTQVFAPPPPPPPPPPTTTTTTATTTDHQTLWFDSQGPERGTNAYFIVVCRVPCGAVSCGGLLCAVLLLC